MYSANNHHTCRKMTMTVPTYNNSIMYDPTDPAVLDYIDYHSYKNKTTNKPKNTLEIVGSNENDENKNDKQYELQRSMFDPMKESPPNTFMNKLETRFKSYHQKQSPSPSLSNDYMFHMISPIN